MAKKKRTSGYKRKTNRPYRRRIRTNDDDDDDNRYGVRATQQQPRRTIKQMSRESVLNSIYEANNNSQDTDEEETINRKFVARIQQQQQQQQSSILADPNRKINGQMTVGQALAVADAVKSAANGTSTPNPIQFRFRAAPAGAAAKTITGSPSKSTTSGFSIKIGSTPTNSTTNKPPIGVPYINPAIKSVLDKFNMQKQQEAGAASGQAPTTLSPSGVPRSIIVNNILNPSEQQANKSHTVKIITVNSSALNNATNNQTGSSGTTATVPGATNKRFLIINNANGPLKTLSAGTTVGQMATAGSASANASPNIVKIVNISQLNGGASVNTSSTTTPQGLVNGNRLIMIKTHPIAAGSAVVTPAVATSVNNVVPQPSMTNSQVLNGEASSLPVTTTEVQPDAGVNTFELSKENDSISMSDMVNETIKLPTIEEVMGVNAGEPLTTL
jgi:hypothetical protein